MSSVLGDAIRRIATVDLFKRNGNGKWETGLFVGRPFYLDYEKAFVLVADAWKNKAKGIPQGSFLLAYYENETDVSEALLLRALKPTTLPTDNDIISSMIEYYKDNLRTAGANAQLDSFTRYEFSFSGLECRILGTFFVENSEDGSRTVRFGADVENFYSAHNYSVVKPSTEVLERLVNFREGMVTGSPSDIRIGTVRYSSTRRFQSEEESVPVYVSAQDFLGTRTALFGMTRTGKSNTVKKIIQATVRMSEAAPFILDSPVEEKVEEQLEPFTKSGVPKYPIGQIIFDINGEYANPNLQDEGTAIYEIYQDQVTRYSVLDKPGFKVMRVNFYNDIASGFELIRSHLSNDSADYVANFLAADLSEPQYEDADENEKRRLMTRYGRKRAAYLCCLYRAGFAPPAGFRLKFAGKKELNELVAEGGKIDPSKGITLNEAVNWFTTIWESYDTNPFFDNYKKDKGYEWADEELKALLVLLTRKRNSKATPNITGFGKLNPLKVLHTNTVERAFQDEIIEELRKGKIIIVDLSQGNPEIQALYSERICRQIFEDSMDRFISTKPNNFIQFYFEEAHNLFPKKEDKNLSQIYNRIAKEGAKLNLGLLYATQEVSSISSNILKNTQNWFIAHLNNEDETREIRKYYDFGDFVDALTRFSASIDKGFVRMKTYSNPFVVPVQIDRFSRDNK